MTEKLAEQLSALMDNECTEHEFPLALRRLCKDSDMLAYWERCHLISDVLKGQTPDVITTSFATCVADLIVQEQTYGPADSDYAASQRTRPVWLKPIAGFALAASVAGVALFALPLGDSGQQESIATLLPESAAVSNDAALAAAPAQEQDDMAEKLNTYLLNHNELATLNGIQGVMPYVKMVNYHASR